MHSIAAVEDVLDSYAVVPVDSVDRGRQLVDRSRAYVDCSMARRSPRRRRQGQHCASDISTPSENEPAIVTLPSPDKRLARPARPHAPDPHALTRLTSGTHLRHRCSPAVSHSHHRPSSLSHDPECTPLLCSPDTRRNIAALLAAIIISLLAAISISLVAAIIISLVAAIVISLLAPIVAAVLARPSTSCGR
ncbi:hypothetical protein K523DRAFT_154372 [Schizophyllum commune Tattone D]|nr:hypothetical protein K523DRAFT_154372 [Schizophyllum commune Tattone D]